MKRSLQAVIQIVFLGLFIFLLVNGKAQLWMGLFLLGIIASFFLGRVYCGWFCSINTVLRGVTWVKKKLNIKSLKTPQFLTKPWVRFLTLGLFVATFIFIMATGKKIPVLPILFTVGIVLTFFFHESLWHHHLCPYGTIIHFPALKSAHHMSINEEKCNNCGACKRVCPSKAIEKNENHHEIIKGDCLVCMDCSISCRQNAISYK